MLQAVMTKPGKIEFVEADIPEINNDEVLVKVMRIGICGSDIHVYYGQHPYTSYPVIQGHEFSGLVVEVGSNVKKVSKGDKVVVQPQVFCGKCYPCRHGDYHICDDLKVMGFQTDGWAREYFKAHQSKVIKVPENMSYDVAAIVEPLAVACHALGKSGMDLAGKNILVLGAGTIGNLVAQAAKAQGAEKVIITDLSDFRLELARRCGIDLAVNGAEVDLAQIIEKEFGPDKADLILECVGVESTITQAVDNARKGSAIIVVGVFPEKVKVDLGLVQDRELRLIGTLMYKEEDYHQAIDLLSRNKINVDLLITDYFDFKDYKKAYEHVDKQGDKAIKVMIKLAD